MKKVIDVTHRGLRRLNPNDANELWCTCCKKYLHKDLFSDRTKVTFNKRSTCKKCNSKNQSKYLPRYHYIRKGPNTTTFGNNSLSSCNRSTYKGFIKYYSNRPEHFEQLFGIKYSIEEAFRCYVEQSLMTF